MRAGARSSAPSFSSHPGMLSGPVALWCVICCSSLRTPSAVTSNLGMSGCGLGPRFGRSVLFSLVKTEVNCELSPLALMMLSLCNIPSLIRDATTVLSHLLLLIYFQNFCGLLAISPHMSLMYFW